MNGRATSPGEAAVATAVVAAAAPAAAPAQPPPLPGAAAPPPLPYFNVAAIRGEMLDQRLRRLGRSAITLGFGGAAAAVLTLLNLGAIGGGIRFAFQSRAVGDTVFFGVPVLLVACLIPVGSSGLRLRAGPGLAAPGAVRRTLLLMRALLLGALLLSLFGTVMGLSGGGGAAAPLFAVVNVACFVGSAVIATRVRDALLDVAAVTRTATAAPSATGDAPIETARPVLPALPAAAAGERGSAVDESIPAVAPVFATTSGAVGELQYAIARDDPVRDFLRRFDLLAIFGCVIYGLHTPAALDNAVVVFGNFIRTGTLAGTRTGIGGAVNAALVALALLTGAGWALWGALYVTFGPVFYRTCLTLASGSMALCVLSAWVNLARPAGLSLSLVTGVMPAVMLFCLTRRRVKATFFER